MYSTWCQAHRERSEMLVIAIIHPSGLSPSTFLREINRLWWALVRPTRSWAVLRPPASFLPSTGTEWVGLPSALGHRPPQGRNTSVCSPLYPRSLAKFLKINAPFSGAVGRVWIWDEVPAFYHHIWSQRVGRQDSCPGEAFCA